MRSRFPNWLHLLAALLLLLPGLVSAQTRVVDLTAARPAVAGVAVTHYRANPLTLRIALDATRPTLTGKESLAVEIRQTVLDAGSALARTVITSPTGAGPFDLTLTGAQLNQFLNRQEKASFWLVVYTLDDGGETLDVLATAPLVLREHGASLTAPAPPNVVGALTKPAADLLYATLEGLAAEATARAAAVTAEATARASAITAEAAARASAVTTEATARAAGDTAIRATLLPNTQRQLLRYRAALATARNGGADAKILCMGDSTTVGYGSSTLSTIPQAKAYPRRLAQIIGGSPGLANGKISGTYKDDRWTVPTGWTISAWGWKGWETGSAVGPLVFTPGDGGIYDRFDVYIIKNPGGGTATITATGGSGTAVNVDGTNGLYKITVSCPASSSAAVSIAQSGQVWVLGVEPWLSTRPTVRVGNAGVNEWKAADWITAGSLPNIGPLACAAAYAPNLTIISLGLNDAAAGVSPATLKTQLQTLINSVKTYSDVMLWIPLPPGPSGVAPVELAPGIASYLTIYRELASENDLPMVDTYARLGSVFHSEFTFDGYHPNDLGYWEIASAVAEALGLPNPAYPAAPEKADNAAADADTTIPSGGFYRVTGSRALLRKP